MLTTPLCVVAFGIFGERPQFAIGFLLPLLCLGDAVSLYHYWRHWRADNLIYLLPGVAIGAWLGVQFIDRMQPHHFSLLIGALAIGFVLWSFIGGKTDSEVPPWQPTHLAGIPCGIGTGLTSTFAHGAGPVVNLFLLPQQLSKIDYVATRTILFTCINWIKMPLFISKDLITTKSLLWGAYFCLLIPIGAWLGVSLNRRIPERQFRLVIYILTLLAGIHLIISSLLTGKSPEERADNFEHQRIEQARHPWKLSHRTCETCIAPDERRNPTSPHSRADAHSPSGAASTSQSKKPPALITLSLRPTSSRNSSTPSAWTAKGLRLRSSRSGIISSTPSSPPTRNPPASTREPCSSVSTAMSGSAKSSATAVRKSCAAYSPRSTAT